MGESPFAKRPALQDRGPGRRRSTRVDFATTMILSGRDATGQAFREYATTSTVNLHGGRLNVMRPILVGMQVIVENPKTAVAEKAICVRADPAPTGEPAHQIAIQLLRPCNIWGVENPPPDWVIQEIELPASTSPRAVSPPSPRPQEASARTPAGAPADAQRSDFERRSAQIVEGALQTLHQQAGEAVREALSDFEQRLNSLVNAAVEHGVRQTHADLESFLETFRADWEGRMADQARLAAESFEERLRARLKSLLVVIEKDFPEVPPATVRGQDPNS